MTFKNSSNWPKTTAAGGSAFSMKKEDGKGRFGSGFSTTKNTGPKELEPDGNEPLDNVNDIRINKNNIVAAATWSGLRLWSCESKKPQTTKPATFTYPKTSTVAAAPSYEPKPIQASCEYAPIFRCDFNSSKSQFLYTGNGYGRIAKVTIDQTGANEEYFGHLIDMVTGLRYNRNRNVLATSSVYGKCYIWDIQNQQGCLEIDTNINCTNLATTDNTVAICGIERDSNNNNKPIVKLYDIRNCQFTSNGARANAEGKEIGKYTPTNPQMEKLISQFTCIELNRNGKHFIAGSLGGILVYSKEEDGKIIYDEFFARPTNNIPQKYKIRQPSSSHQNTDPVIPAYPINSLAVVTKRIDLSQQKEIMQNVVYAGLGSGDVVAFTAFREQKSSKGQSKNIPAIFNYTAPSKSDGQKAVTACAVSPNGDILVTAYGYDYAIDENVRRDFSPVISQDLITITMRTIDPAIELNSRK